MKTIIYLLFFLILYVHSNLFAQIEKAELAILSSTHIIDGKVINFNFNKKTNNDFSMTYLIEVKQLLKGDNQVKTGDTIIVTMDLPERYQVFEDGSYGKNQELRMPSNHLRGWSMGKNTQGIFALKISENITNEAVKFVSFEPSLPPKENSYFLIKPYLVKYDVLEQVNICTYTIEGFGLNFNNFTKFNSFLSQMNLPVLKDIHPFEKKSKETLLRDSLNAIQYAQRVEKSNEIKEFLYHKIAAENNSSEKAIENVTFEIINEEITGTSTQYFEFDIMISGSTSNTYLDNAAFVLEFNTFAFGVDLSANNLVAISRGADFNNITYIDPMTSVTDDAPNKIRFGIGTDYAGTSWNRVQITPTPNTLLHLKLKLIDCQGFTDLAFDDIANVSVVDMYTNNPSISPLDAPYLAYDYADYVQPNNYELCPPPAITDFYPQVISAGTNSILTIIGNGFGENRGASQVRFMDADTANTTIQFLDAVDYISWTDNEIKIKMPYFVDSLAENFHPGSGTFSIKKGNGETINSPSPLTIKYAAMNYFYGTFGNPDYEKIPYRHVDFTSSLNGHAREFSLDTSITNNPQMAALVHKALRTWTCVTGINWVVVDTTNIPISDIDNISIIYLTDTEFAGDTTLGLAESRKGQLCFDLNDNNSKFIFWKETDIALARYMNISNQTPVNWLYDSTYSQDLPTGAVDFYQTILHELGHAHYLGHVRESSEMMYYGILPGPVDASSRLKLYSSPNSMEGGTYISTKNFATQSASCGGTIGTTTPQYASYCGDLGVFPYQKQIKNEITVYPNPFNQSITLDFELPINTEVSYQVYDLSGRKIFQKEKYQSKNQMYSEEINLNNCDGGLYMLSIQAGNESSVYRIIKTQ